MPEFALDILKQVVGASALGALAWFGGPLKWIIHNYQLKRLLAPGRRFVFTFNAHTGASKLLTFREDGTIGEGCNENEHTWRIVRGKLEILAADGKVYSRFAYEKQSGQLKHTNDEDTRSLRNQHIEPSLVRVTKAAQQGAPGDDPRRAGSDRT